MKRPAKQLLDDLLEDSTSPEFRSALMDKTLRSARRRKRIRRLNLTLGTLALAALFAFAFQQMNNPKTAPNQVRRPIFNAAPMVALNPVRVVSTKINSLKYVTISDFSDSTLMMVQTSESDRPIEINDKELLALAGDKPVALIHQGRHQSELIFIDPKDKNGIPFQ